MIKKTLKWLDKVVFFIPRLIIKGVQGIARALDKKDVVLIVGLSSLSYGCFIVSPPLAFIVIGLLFLKLAGL